jgi:hypothetical protein
MLQILSNSFTLLNTYETKAQTLEDAGINFSTASSIASGAASIVYGGHVLMDRDNMSNLYRCLLPSFSPRGFRGKDLAK